ncbi:MAG TPA: formate--phosphoribosylaminoimidazolecarboxamide ligase [Candidatus Bilamarchaeaceae archaeon]|nr:formate--phosphoribosylaminoimidazolecarboxamide ligase [Candidatus Bilamarchaeaceae archaeon]
MVPKEKIHQILDGYKDFSIATICSHSSLQIFKGARDEGLRTIGIVKKENKKLYEAFQYGKPDEFLVVEEYSELPVDELRKRNAIIVPHGSFVEYVGSAFEKLEVPIYGNRASVMWERSREKMFEWLRKARIRAPRILQPDEIAGPALVKFPGAKGGRGYFIVTSQSEFKRKVGNRPCMIQEFLIGVRSYPHFFFSSFSKIGYETGHGWLELLGVDRRVESSADEIARAVSAGMSPKMSFTVIGNEPLVLRESLLGEYMEMGKRLSDASFDLFGGMFGPFSIETIITEELEIYAFEISARIVAGTNVYPQGSSYSDYHYNQPMSMGRRIARELKLAWKNKKIKEIVY